MAGIGLGSFQLVIARLLHLPVLATRVFAGQEIREQDRLVPAPHAARAAEIRDSALGADPGAGESNRARGLRQVAGDSGGQRITSNGFRFHSMDYSRVFTFWWYLFCSPNPEDTKKHQERMW